MRQAAQFTLGDHRAHGLLQHAEQRLDIFRLRRLRLEVHRNHDVRTHLADYVGGQIVYQASVDVHVLAVVHGRECARDRHRGAQRLGERTILEHELLGANQVRGHTAKRHGQRVKRGHPKVRERLAVDQQADLVPGIESRRQMQTFAKTYHQRGRVCALILLAQERQILVRRAIAQNLIPVEALDQILHLLRANPRCIEASDQPAHTCAGDEIHRDVLLLKPLQHPDVRQPQRAAAFQGHANLQPLLYYGSRLFVRSDGLLRKGKSGKHK